MKINKRYAVTDLNGFLLAVLSADSEKEAIKKYWDENPLQENVKLGKPKLNTFPVEDSKRHKLFDVMHRRTWTLVLGHAMTTRAASPEDALTRYKKVFPGRNLKDYFARERLKDRKIVSVIELH